MKTTFLKKRRVIYSEINVVPFLDVLLVLLIIFMMIPSELAHVFKINLPDSSIAKSDIRNHDKHFMTIEITEPGLYNIFTKKKYIKNIRLNQLSAEIIAKKSIYPDIVCLLAASKSIKYDEVIQVLNLINNLKINSVGIITNPINI